jgi:excinuclease UvrABC ATPase subunit
MSTAHIADSHDMIRVHGARENNLKNIDVELPKRRLTVFTGVSGSGKSSLVFATIAADSQRMINETYSAFLQGFMPARARPDVDRLEGLTTAIIVDQERMGANVRSTVGTATDANTMLRVLFSRLGDPHIGPPNAYSFNVPSVTGAGAVTVDRGEGRTRAEKRTYTRLGGMCPRCEGMGNVSDIDLHQLYDETKSLADGALSIPGYTTGGWNHRLYASSGLFPADKPIARFSKRELHDFLYREPVRMKIENINMTYEGLIPRIQKSMLSKDVEAMQPHIRAFVERAVTFSACPECGGTRLAEAARSSKINGSSIADVAAMQISDLADWLRAVDDPSVAPLVAALQHLFDSFVDIGLGYLSLDRPAGTLSGGEAQRTKMIRHLGSSLTDVSYVFDEPTIGLHPHDITRMNDLLCQLRDKGNTVLVVEHKPEVIEIADHIVDLGPGAGAAGGPAPVGHPHRAPPRRPGDVEDLGSHSYRNAGGAWGRHTQPAGGRCRHSARGARRGHRGGRVGQELADPWLGERPRRGGQRRPGPDPRVEAQQPGDVHVPARAHSQGVRQGQRRQTGAVQRQLRRSLPHLQRGRGDLHRTRLHGDGHHDLRGV